MTEFAYSPWVTWSKLITAARTAWVLLSQWLHRHRLGGSRWIIPMIPIVVDMNDGKISHTSISWKCFIIACLPVTCSHTVSHHSAQVLGEVCLSHSFPSSSRNPPTSAPLELCKDQSSKVTSYPCFSLGTMAIICVMCMGYSQSSYSSTLFLPPPPQSWDADDSEMVLFWFWLRMDSSVSCSLKLELLAVHTEAIC